MKSVNHSNIARISSGAPLGATGRTTHVVTNAPNTGKAQNDLEALVTSLFDAQPLAFAAEVDVHKQAGLVAMDGTMAETSRSQINVLERRLQQTIRSLRREGKRRDSSAAKRVLANDALRLQIEVLAWKNIETIAGKSVGGANPWIAIQSQDASEVTRGRAIYQQLTSSSPVRHQQLLSLLSKATPTDKKASSAKSLRPTKASALIDILSSTESQHGALIREHLGQGGSITSVREMLVERDVPLTLEAADEKRTPPSEGKVAGLVFDLGTNTWVAKDRSWAYPITLGQLFDYQVDGICDGRSELTARLVAAATDPTTSQVVGTSEAEIAEFVDALADAAGQGHTDAERLLAQPFEMCFSTTDGGSVPVEAHWELPRKAVADLFAATSDKDLRASIVEVADTTRSQAALTKAKLLEPLGDLLEKYPGVPRRHKRAHAALINLGMAGASVANMSREGGVLPRSETLLTPEILTNRYADADNLKVRFLFTDNFETFVISDETFDEVVNKYGFPPNHELLSYNRPIAGSGYFTIHQGEIVAIEDDIVMLPGKLPDGLPPAKLVLDAHGFPMDEERIAESNRVLDWDSFLDLGKAKTEKVAVTDTSAARDSLIDIAHAERPAMVASMLRTRFAELKASGANDKDARKQTVEFAEALLSGFHIINVAANDFRSGSLPNTLSEFSDLSIDATLASYVVKAVVK